MTKINKASVVIASWAVVGFLYSPIFICAWFLRIFARILLSLAYFGMLNGKMGKAVWFSLFTWNNQI